MTRSLVIHDADRIQDYIFATGRLREIRGASALVDTLSTTAAPGAAPTQLDLMLDEYPGTELIFAGGGNVTLWSPTEEAGRRFEADYARRFWHRTGQASSTGVTLPSDGPYLASFQRAMGLLQDKKNRAVGGPFLETGGLLRPCQSCSRQPASFLVPDQDGQEARLCGTCRSKRQFAGEDLPRIYQDFFHGEEHRRRFSLVPEDFAEIGAACSAGGYIGVVYCDGNRIGARIQQITQEAFNQAEEQEKVFRDFSRRLDSATRQSIVAVLRQHWPAPIPRRNGGPYYPFQIILCGGDDLLVVLPADRALAVAADFIEEFNHSPLGLTTSAGVVLAKDSYPFRDLVRLSKELLKSAKQRSRALNGEGCLDAMVITSSSMSSLKQDRERSYRGRDAHVDLAPQPLTVAEYRRYEAAIRRLSAEGFPTNKIYGLYRELWRGFVPSLLFYYEIYGRANAKHKRLLDDLAAILKLTDGPWQEPEADGLRRSPFGLIGEWYEFLRSAPEEIQ